MASIKKRGDTYLITVSMGFDHTGKRLRETTTYTPSATTEKKIAKEVEDFARDFEKRVKEGLYLDGDKITFCQFCDRWEKDYAADNLTVNVLEGYKAQLERNVFPYIGNMKLSKITALHIQNIYRELKDRGYKPASIRRIHCVISSVLSRAYKWGIVQENVAKRCDLPKLSQTQTINCFTLEQAEKFLDILDQPLVYTIKGHDRKDDTGKKYSVGDYEVEHEIPFQFKVFFTLAIYSGCRRGELAALTWNDIDFENNTITISKSISKTKAQGQIVKEPKTAAGHRTITLPASCMRLLKEWKKQEKSLALALGSKWEGKRGREFEENYIFIQLASGRPMDLQTPTHKFREILTAYNARCTSEEDKLPMIRLHDLRHTNATLLISQNTDIRTVAGRLGHSKASVTLDIYSHVLKASDEKAAETLENLFSHAQ